MNGNDIRWTMALVAALAITPMVADAKSYRTHSTSSSGHAGHSNASDAPHDSHGKIKRSREAKHAFKKEYPCPSTGKSHGACPGYVIDHVTPLKRGGADSPSNMQWQTKEAAKIKDRTE